MILLKSLIQITKKNYMYERNYILINTIGVTMFFYQKLLLDKISDEIKI